MELAPDAPAAGVGAEVGEFLRTTLHSSTIRAPGPATGLADATRLFYYEPTEREFHGQT